MLTKRIFYLIGALESIASFIWLITIERSEKSAIFLGFSLQRWLLLAPMFILSITFLWQLLSVYRKPNQNQFLDHWFDAITKNRTVLVLATMILVFVLVYSLFGVTALVEFISKDRQFYPELIPYSKRLIPVLFLIFVLCTQTVLFLVAKTASMTKGEGKIEEESMQKGLSKSKLDIVAIILLGAFMALLLWVPTQKFVFADIPSDYVVHIGFAQDDAENKSPTMPHFLFHLLVIILQKIPGIDFSVAAILVVLGFFTILSTLVYVFIRSSYKQENSIRYSITSFLISASLLIVSPITLFTWAEKILYRGYLGINTYHNPTIIALKPLAFLVFLYSMKVFIDQKKRPNHREIVSAGVLSITSILIKPSYAICLLPALALVVGYRFIKKQLIDWRLLIFGIGIPSIVVLGWQYYFYFFQEVKSNIIFSPLLLSRDSLSWIILKFFLSILFPLCVYFLHFKIAKRDLWLNFSWLVFLIGSFYSYFLAQSGQEVRAGNFGWSAGVALFILFLVSMKFFLRNSIDFTRIETPKGLVKIFFIISIYGLHLISGLWFYFSLLQNPVLR